MAIEDLVRPVDAAFEAFARDKRIPGVAWGVVAHGALAYSGGTGIVRDGEPARPDADTVYRIASMTKSFTAAAILLLRDEGRLRLDDPVADHVPALAAWRPLTGDAQPVTIRDLLTMAAGLPTDDPWGDRQQALPFDRFDALLRAGPVFAWPPGTRFEYSNLGYGILGRVVTAAAGREYRDVVRERLMVPLRMASSGYGEEEVDAARLAHGYQRVDDGLVREGTDGYGALASMGGAYSTVRDLATWVAGFLDAFPARDDPEGGHPLRRATRREMQQVHRTWPMETDDHRADQVPVAEAGGYGYGLTTSSRTDVGTIVGHGGGYPGYGSYMVWHPASGLGVVAAGNLRYAQVRGVAIRQLVALLQADVVPRRAITPLPQVAHVAEVVTSLLASWDDRLADAWFAMNMDLDEARHRRRAAVERAVDSVGRPLGPDPERPVVTVSAAERRWWLRGERGWVKVALLLSPEPTPRIQVLQITPIVDPSPGLVAARDRLLAAATDRTRLRGPGVSDEVDLDIVARGVAVLAARSPEPLEPGRVLDGDGITSTTWELGGPAGGTLRVSVDPNAATVTAVDVRVAGREAPTEAW
jgi:CubicO group peptidase (beta-lactamase class C family)